MGSYDAWKEAGPHDDCGSVEQATCDEPGCDEPGWECDDGEHLCERHLDEWLLRVRSASDTLDESLADTALGKDAAE